MQGRVKITYIVDTFDIGGREKVVLDLCNGLNKNIFDVSLIVLSNDRLSSSKFLNKDVKIYALNINQKELRSLNLFFKGVWQFIDIIKELSPNIVHSHIFYMPLFLTSLAVKLSNKNILHFRTVHTSGLFYENQKTLLNKFRLFVEKFAIKINLTYLIGISKVVHTNNIKYFKKYNKNIKFKYHLFINWFYFLQEQIIKLKKSESLYNKKLVSFFSISESENREMIRNSIAILDIHHPLQSGLTMRTIEALGMGSKIITTNKDIKNYNFYNPNSILIVDRNNIQIPDYFFEKENNHFTSEDKKKYSLEQWVIDIFKICELKGKIF